MKKLMLYLLLISTSIISMGAGCSKDDDKIEKEQSDALLGYWTIKGGNSRAIKQDGSEVVIATVNPDVTALEFRGDGTYTGYDLTGTFLDEDGTWDLDVFQVDKEDINQGTLSLSTQYTKENAGKEFIDAEGSIKYEIGTIFNFNNTGKSRMYLTTKRYEVEPYKEVWNYYIYEKK